MFSLGDHSLVLSVKGYDISMYCLPQLICSLKKKDRMNNKIIDQDDVLTPKVHESTFFAPTMQGIAERTEMNGDLMLLSAKGMTFYYDFSQAVRHAREQKVESVLAVSIPHWIRRDMAHRHLNDLTIKEDVLLTLHYIGVLRSTDPEQNRLVKRFGDSKTILALSLEKIAKVEIE